MVGVLCYLSEHFIIGVYSGNTGSDADNAARFVPARSIHFFSRTQLEPNLTKKIDRSLFAQSMSIYALCAISECALMDPRRRRQSRGEAVSGARVVLRPLRGL